MNDYDSTQDTLNHIKKVSDNIEIIINHLINRQKEHDQSKLSPEEKRAFDTYTPKLSGVTYGSEKYLLYLREMKKALDHHHLHNRHHPEHFVHGISGMNLVDLIEMFCDWIAATKRHNDGSIFKSIEIQKEKLDLPNELVDIFINTAMDIFGEKA